MSLNTFKTRQTLKVGNDSLDYYSLPALEAAGFVGCIETDEQLATTYKNRIDFSTASCRLG